MNFLQYFYNQFVLLLICNNKDISNDNGVNVDGIDDDGVDGVDDVDDN